MCLKIPCCWAWKNIFFFFFCRLLQNEKNTWDFKNLWGITILFTTSVKSPTLRQVRSPKKTSWILISIRFSRKIATSTHCTARERGINFSISQPLVGSFSCICFFVIPSQNAKLMQSPSKAAAIRTKAQMPGLRAFVSISPFLDYSWTPCFPLEIFSERFRCIHYEGRGNK